MKIQATVMFRGNFIALSLYQKRRKLIPTKSKLKKLKEQEKEQNKAKTIRRNNSSRDKIENRAKQKINETKRWQVFEKIKKEKKT